MGPGRQSRPGLITAAESAAIQACGRFARRPRWNQGAASLRIFRQRTTRGAQCADGMAAAD
jgi:hypothetical protein